MPLAARKPAATFARKPDKPKIDAGVFTILIAEDNEINIKVLQQFLSQFNCALAIARDGRAAVRTYRTHKIDAILMDIQMPELDGFDAAREIRRIERMEGSGPVPIIAVTAHVQPADQHLCIDAGMNDYLQKPVNFAALTGAFRVWAPALVRLPKPRAVETGAAND